MEQGKGLVKFRSGNGEDYLLTDSITKKFIGSV
jgi:hypothetical protein